MTNKKRKKENEKKVQDWITQAEFARRHGISRPSVHDAIRNGRLESNGKSGHDCRVRPEFIADQILDDGKSLEEKKKEADIARIKSSIALNQQKLSANVAAMRRAWMQQAFDSFAQSFSPLKAKLAELRLTEQQLEVLRHLIDDCLLSLQSNLERDDGN